MDTYENILQFFDNSKIFLSFRSKFQNNLNKIPFFKKKNQNFRIFEKILIFLKFDFLRFDFLKFDFLKFDFLKFDFLKFSKFPNFANFNPPPPS